jgi:hypothetical protein
MGDPVTLLSRTLADMGSVSSATSSVKRQLTIPVMLPRQVLSRHRSRDIQGGWTVANPVGFSRSSEFLHLTKDGSQPRLGI